MTRIRAPQDALAGLIFAGLGASGLAITTRWPVGTLASMQTGFVPAAISGLLLCLGVVVLAGALANPGPALDFRVVKPLFVVLGAVVAFIASLETLGLVPAIVLIVGCSALSGQAPGPRSLAALAAGLSLLCAAIFVVGLSMPIKLWPF
jgi:hypothetical protein